LNCWRVPRQRTNARRILGRHGSPRCRDVEVHVHAHVDVEVLGIRARASVSQSLTPRPHTSTAGYVAHGGHGAGGMGGRVASVSPRLTDVTQRNAYVTPPGSHGGQGQAGANGWQSGLAGRCPRWAGHAASLGQSGCLGCPKK
jgi:hypothetical protein